MVTCPQENNAQQHHQRIVWDTLYVTLYAQIIKQKDYHHLILITFPR